MKLVNAVYGYDSVPAAEQKRRWYRWPQFPLIPMWEYRPAEGLNTSAWSFSWLFLRYWSLDHVSFKFEVEIDSALGGGAFRIGAILPYTRLILFTIPLPLGWLYRLRRRCPHDYSQR